MSLDLAILSRDGRPEKVVSLSVDLHHKLMVVSNRFGLNELNRLDDYYSDIDFMPDDLSRLLDQVNALLLNIGSDDLSEILIKFKELINIAVLRREVIHAIAD